jgi:hypothetical protein
VSNSWSLGVIMSTATQTLGNRSDLAASTVSFWSNEALRMVWDAMPHDLQEGLAVSSSTSGEDKITKPSDFQELLTLSNLSTSPADVLEPINLHQLESWTTDLGAPTHYHEYADWLELRPSPDSAYSFQMRYRKQVSTMTATTAIPSVATRYRYSVFLKTVELLAQNVTRDPATAAEFGTRYAAEMLATAPDRALRLREQRYASVSLPVNGRFP